MDFESRKLPCKHMYRLAETLGIIKIISRPSLMPGDIRKETEIIKQSGDVDNDPKQIARQKKAMTKECDPIKIENSIGEFKGSSGNYNTSLTDCTCTDFKIRRLPCKHIYRLRMELIKSFTLDKKDNK